MPCRNALPQKQHGMEVMYWKTSMILELDPMLVTEKYRGWCGIFNRNTHFTTCAGVTVGFSGAHCAFICADFR